MYLKRKEKGKWDEQEELDDKRILDVEKKIYLEMFPHNQGVFGEDENGSGDNDDDVEEMSEDNDYVSVWNFYCDAMMFRNTWNDPDSFTPIYEPKFEGEETGLIE